MPQYTISRVPTPERVAHNAITIVAGVFADDPQQALQHSIEGRATCDEGLGRGKVYPESFTDGADEQDWFFVNNDDRLHDFGLFKLVGKTAVNVR